MSLIAGQQSEYDPEQEIQNWEDYFPERKS
jgi:hypothetical protein